MLGLYSEEYKGDVINQWDRYEELNMFTFVAISILLTVSTYLSLSHMRKVFGTQSLKEEKSIKCLLYIFCGSYLLRVVFAFFLHFYKQLVRHVFQHDNTYFALSVLGLWISWDVFPMFAILLVHYKNFKSF